MTATAAVGPALTERSNRLYWRGWLMLTLCLMMVLATAASIIFGSREVAIDQVVAAFTRPDPNSLDHAAVLERVPRTLLGIVVGAGLALSGASMQGVTRNPLADPGILGINSGAALLVLIGMAFFGLSNFVGIVIVAFLGAALTAVLVYVVGSLGPGGTSPLKLALSGAALTAALSSLMSAILLPRIELMTSFRFWQVGGLGAAHLDTVLQALPACVIGALLVVGGARGLNAIALSDDVAASLGISLTRARLTSAAGAVLLAGTATALAGPIAFVGLVVPHLARLLFGSDYRWILGAAIPLGATLMLLADVAGRVLARPAEVEVGITMALIGAPVFVAIVRGSRLKEL